MKEKQPWVKSELRDGEYVLVPIAPREDAQKYQIPHHMHFLDKNFVVSCYQEVCEKKEFEDIYLKVIPIEWIPVWQEQWGKKG